MKSLSDAEIQRDAKAMQSDILNTQAPFASNPHEASVHEQSRVIG
jgi:hypothetical protein